MDRHARSHDQRIDKREMVMKESRGIGWEEEEGEEEGLEWMLLPHDTR